MTELTSFVINFIFNLLVAVIYQQVPVTSADELGQLTTTFNQMSADLVKADQQRKRMTADITHDLSTPLQVISGYIEMLEEDDITLTPQRLDIIKFELEHLRRLVGDLSTFNPGGSQSTGYPGPAGLASAIIGDDFPCLPADCRAIGR